MKNSRFYGNKFKNLIFSKNFLKSSMDLLSALPEDVFNEVVSYLKPANILKASLVCKIWYQIFGQSDECMQKVTVNYNFYNRNNDLNPLLKSDRKYQNVIIEFNHHQLQDSGFEPKIKSILKKFSKSIVKLHTSHDFHRICELPKLKELNYMNSRTYNYVDRKFPNYFYSNGLLVMCPNISRLVISTESDLTGKYLKNLQEAIKNMRNLKSLSVYEIKILKDFQPADCKFRLEEYVVPDIRDTKIVHDFLKHHRSTLKCLKFSFLDIKHIPFILSAFPKLQTLQVSYFRDYSSKKPGFPENSTITNLIITNSIHEQETRYQIADLFIKLKNLQQVRFDILYSRFIPELFASESLTCVKYKKISDLVTEYQKNWINTNERIKFVQIPWYFGIARN